MNKERDLIGSILEVLAHKYMRSAGAELAENARTLFDALECLEREQKIRNWRKTRERLAELTEEVSKLAVARNWRIVDVLAKQYFAALGQLPSLELAVLCANQQEKVLGDVASGDAGVEKFVEFAGQVDKVVGLEVDHELAEAAKRGRQPELGDRPRETTRRLESIAIAAEDLFARWDETGKLEPAAAFRLGVAIYGDGHACVEAARRLLLTSEYLEATGQIAEGATPVE